MRPLDPMRSIKTKLGVLVAATVAAATVLAAVGTGLGVSAWLVVPATVAVALGLTQLLARGMTSPLREMTGAARGMATGDYSRRVTASSRDEVGDLARAFNTMAADLEAVDRRRRELVANVSHELRTPVSALQALLENLVDGVVAPDHERLRVALTQTERLGRLVEDLLDLSRLDAGTVALSAEPVRVGDLLDGAVREARLSDHPVDYRVEVAPPDLVLTADPARLHQLLANLLDNAGRHSPPGGTVVARGYHRLDRAGGRMVLEVADDGPGIAPEDRPRIFERFTTGAERKRDGGTGLGLAIAHWVTTLHGGDIEVVDRPTGCLIRASLPAHVPTSSPTAPTPEEATR